MSSESFAASLALVLACQAFSATAGDATSCHELCPNGIDTGPLAQCLSGPADAAMTDVYDAVVDLGLATGAGGEETDVLAGLNVLSAQKGKASTAEGLTFCLPGGGGGAFYWNPDCTVAPMLCSERTADEIELGNIGYVVDSVYHGDDLFHRYAFNATTLVETSYQSPTLSTGFQCATLPWFKTGKCANDGGVSITCPEETTGNPNPIFNGWNAAQYIGDVEAVVVAQQLRNAGLEPCLEELNAAKMDVDESNAKDEVESSEMGSEKNETSDSNSNAVMKGFVHIFFFFSLAIIWR